METPTLTREHLLKLCGGNEPHRADGWTADMLPPGMRPLLFGEQEMKDDEHLDRKSWLAVPRNNPAVRGCGELDKHERTKRPITSASFKHPQWGTKREFTAPTPAQAEPTAQTAGEAAYNYWFKHGETTSWEDQGAECNQRWEECAQAVLAFTQSSRAQTAGEAAFLNGILEGESATRTYASLSAMAREKWERSAQAAIAFVRSSREQKINTRCPACNSQTLVIGSGGLLVCSLIGCSNPTLINERAEAAEQTIADLRRSLEHREAFTKEVEKHRDRATQEAEDLKGALTRMEESNKENYATYDEAMKRLESDRADLRKENAELHEALRVAKSGHESADVRVMQAESDLTAARESLRKAEEGRDIYRAVLEGMEFEQLDTLATKTVALAKAVGIKAKERIASLKASSGWVALSERKPTREDADENENVLWYWTETKTLRLARWDEWRASDLWLSIPPRPTPPRHLRPDYSHQLKL